MDIVGIGNQQIDYPDKDERAFHSLYDYISMTKKMIKYFAPRMGPNLCHYMLKDEDVIANIATKIMMGDWRWDEEHNGKESGKPRAKYSYRNQCCYWAIQEYLERLNTDRPAIEPIEKYWGSKGVHGKGSTNRKKSKNVPYDLEYATATWPDKTLERQENIEASRGQITKLLNSGYLTPKQSNYIKLHYLEYKSLVEIGQINNISAQSVKNTIEGGIRKLRELTNSSAATV